MTALEPPNLSEVIRRLDEMRQDLRAYAQDSLSIAVYQADNVARDREMKEVKADLVALQAKHDAAVEQQRQADAAASKAREETARARDEAASRNRLMWVSIFATPIAGAIVLWLLNGGLHVGG